MKRYPCVGGPLDGLHVTSEDLRAPYAYVRAGTRPGGQFAQYHDEYARFNRADRYASLPTMIWLWKGLIR